MLDQRKIVITAKKTNKTHVIPIGQNASDHFTSLYKLMGKPPKRDIILVGQKGEEGKAVSIQYINRTLKKWAVKYDLDIDNFSTHTFRKTFGRYVYDKGGQDERLLCTSIVFSSIPA